MPESARDVTIGSAEDLGTLFVIYGAGFGALFVVVTLMYRHVGKRADTFGLTPLQRHDARWIARHYALFVAAAVISIVVAQLGLGLAWGAPGFAYAILGPACYLNGRAAEKTAPK